MSRQILVKSLKNPEQLIKEMFDEAMSYLVNIGFTRTPLISITESTSTFRAFAFSQGNEKVILEYKASFSEEVLKLSFEPLKVKFIYDILVMRFNQIAKEDKESVFIYNE